MAEGVAPDDLSDGLGVAPSFLPARKYSGAIPNILHPEVGCRIYAPDDLSGALAVARDAHDACLPHVHLRLVDCRDLISGVGRN